MMATYRAVSFFHLSVTPAEIVYALASFRAIPGMFAMQPSERTEGRMNRILTRLTQVAIDPALRADGQLLEAFLAERSEPAFRELVARHGGLVLGVCNRVLRHRQDAEDAFQAVFLVLARRAADVRPRDAVGSWLYGVAHRVALKARSARARRLTREQSLGEKPWAAASSGSGELAELIHSAVRNLPDVYRVAILACDLEGLSRAEAATRLGWKEGTLSGRLSRARQLLADRLRRTGVALPASGISAILATTDAVAAELAAVTVRLAVGSSGGNLAVGVSAPIATLAERVVEGMFLTKIKATVAAILAIGALGFGMWAAAGARNGPGDSPAGNDGERPGLAVADQKQQSAKRDPDLEKMQGTWWILSIGDANKMQSIDPNTQRDPRQFAITIRDDQFIFPRHPSFQNVIGNGKITLDPTRNPKHIDIAHEGGTLTGVYEFVTPKPNDDIIQLRLSLPHVGGVRSGGFLKGGLGAVELILGKFADPKRDPTSDEGLAPGVKHDLSAAESRHDLVCRELEQALATIKARGKTNDLDRLADFIAVDKAHLDAAMQLLDQVEVEVIKARLRAKPAPTLPNAKMSSDLARMQGRWRVVSIWDGQKQKPIPANGAQVYEIVGDKFYGPLRGSQERGEKPHATIVLHPNTSPGQLDLIFASNKVGTNIYRFTPGTQPNGENLWLAGGNDSRPISFDGIPGQLGVLELTKITDAPGSEKLSGDLARMQGRWRVDTIGDGKKQQPLPVKDAHQFLIVGDKMYSAPDQPEWEERVSTIVLRSDKNPAEIDLDRKGEGLVPCIYRFASQTENHPGNLWIVFPKNPTVIGNRPTSFEPDFKKADVLELTRVDDKAGAADTDRTVRIPRFRRELFDQEVRVFLEEEANDGPVSTPEEFEQQLDRKSARLAAAQALIDDARGELEREKMRTAEAQRKLAAAKPGEEFTVRVRPLAAAEKVIRVRATGKETVMEGLAYAAEDMAIKADALSVWLVRGREVLLVDLVAITQKGDAKTNHTLMPGDKLVVQVRVGK
jgi:RNA polymerase sigma factor (sigma-70 family)